MSKRKKKRLRMEMIGRVKKEVKELVLELERHKGRYDGFRDAALLASRDIFNAEVRIDHLSNLLEHWEENGKTIDLNIIGAKK